MSKSQTLAVEPCSLEERHRFPRKKGIAKVSYGIFTHGDEITVEFFIARSKRARSWNSGLDALTTRARSDRGFFVTGFVSVRTQSR
jgi:hypothetical protein